MNMLGEIVNHPVYDVHTLPYSATELRTRVFARVVFMFHRSGTVGRTGIYCFTNIHDDKIK